MNDSTVIEMCRALGDPVRWAIVAELRDGTRCACELADVAEVGPSLLSHHLKVLRELRLVTAKRRGRWIDYTLSPATLRGLADVLGGEMRSPESLPSDQRHPQEPPASCGSVAEGPLGTAAELMQEAR